MRTIRITGGNWWSRPALDVSLEARTRCAWCRRQRGRDPSDWNKDFALEEPEKDDTWTTAGAPSSTETSRGGCRGRQRRCGASGASRGSPTGSTTTARSSPSSAAVPPAGEASGSGAGRSPSTQAQHQHSRAQRSVASPIRGVKPLAHEVRRRPPARGTGRRLPTRARPGRLAGRPLSLRCCVLGRRPVGQPRRLLAPAVADDAGRAL